MTYKTHMTTGVALSIATCGIFVEPFHVVGYVAGAAAGSLLPDLDHSKSYIRKYVPFPHMKHRGVTHSLVGFLVFSLVLVCLWPCSFTVGIITGYLSHLLADMFTDKGIPIMWPNKKRYRIASIKTGSDQEQAFKWFVITGLIYYIYERWK